MINKGGASLKQVGCFLFRAFFFDNGFVDLGFQGLRFTYNKGQLF